MTANALGLPCPLTPLDQCTYRIYTRIVLSFPLPPSPDQDVCIRVLRHGLEKLANEIPITTSQVSLSPDGEISGWMEIRPNPLGAVDLKVKDFTASDSPWVFESYDSLDAKRFPSSLLDPAILAPTPILPDPKTPTPVMAAQANFIPGGLLLCVAIHHSVTDGVGMAAILRTWAKWCQRGPDSRDTYQTGLRFVLDRSRLLKGSAEVKESGHPEYKIVDLSQSQAPKPESRIEPPKTEQSIFYFSAESLTLLKQKLSNALPIVNGGTPKPWISTSDALTALLWGSVTRARVPRLKDTLMRDPETKTHICVAVDGRKRLDPPLPPEYIGNCIMLGYMTASLSTLTSATSPPILSRVALSIRDCVTQVDNDHILSAITYIESAADVRSVVPSINARFGTDWVMTSWAEWGLMDVDWGNAVGGRPTSVRIPKHPLDGYCIVYPRLLDGGLEVLVWLEQGDMERLKDDPVLGEFGKWKCS
jgi:Transferase family